MAAAACAAIAVFFQASPSHSAASVKASMGPGGGPDSLDSRGVKSKLVSSSRAMQVKANAQVAAKINGTSVGLKTDSSTTGDDVSSDPRTFYNQLPDLSVLLAAVTTIFLVAEKQWTLLDWKPKRPDMLVDAFGLGNIIHDRAVFMQSFSIRSYEIGADRTATIETLMNHLQETALNQARNEGLMREGFGSTPEMSRRNLIWVVAKMQVIVEHYPSWGDVVDVETWVGASGKNGMRRDWHVRDRQTGRTITRASSVWVMMNKQTRRLSKIPEEVRAEIGHYFIERSVILDEDGRKLAKLDDKDANCVRKGLTPRWGDLDVNQHVNNVKYIGWILESVPISILENNQLASLTLEYRRECTRDSVVQSLTAIDGTEGSPDASMECTHLLRLEDGAEVVRCRTGWRPKPSPLGSASAEKNV